MPISTTCTGCKVTLKVPDEVAGKAIKCPKCAAVFKVAPANGTAAPAAAKPAAPAAAKPAPPAGAAAKPAAPAGAAGAPAKTPPAAPKPAAPPAAKPAAAAPAPGAAAKAAPAAKPATPAAKPAAPAAALKADKPAAKAAPPAPLPIDEIEEEDDRPKKPAARKAKSEPPPIEEIDEEEEKPKKGGKKGKAEADDKAPLEVDKEDPFEGLDISDDIQKEIQQELTKKEKIRWVGRQDLEMMLFKAWFAIPVGAVFLLVGLIAMISMLFTMEFPMSLIGVGVFFVCALISVPCMMARWLLKKFAHKRAVYVITNRRAILYGAQAYTGSKVASYSPIQLRKMERKESSYWKGCGSLVFDYKLETVHHGGSGRRMGGSSTVKVPIGFIDIRDVKKVDRFLRETLIETVTDKLLSDEKPAKKKKDEDEGPPEILDPNEKAAPGVKAKKAAEEEVDDPNVKSAPGVKAKKKAADEPEELEEVDENVTAAPGVKTKAKAKEEPEELEEADDNVRSTKKSGDDDLPESEDVPDRFQEMVNEELGAKEKVLWIGQPHRKLVFMRALMKGIGTACIGLFIGSILSCVGFLSSTGPVFIGIIGVLVMVGTVGGGLAFPFFKRWQQSNSVYALTNKRCLVFQANFIGKPQLTVYNPEELVNMYRRDAWFVKGGGDVVFKTRTVITTTHSYGRRTGRYMGSSTSVQTYYYGFLSIGNAREVEHLIREKLVDPILDKLTDNDD